MDSNLVHYAAIRRSAGIWLVLVKNMYEYGVVGCLSEMTIGRELG